MRELSQTFLPMSLSFYDPILNLLQHKISTERKEFFHTKNKCNFQNEQKSIYNYIKKKLTSDNLVKQLKD